MIECALIMMAAEMESMKLRHELEKKWQEEFDAASPEIKSVMLKVRLGMAEEAKIERRHQEQIRAQHEIADAIRYAARPGRHFFDF